MMNQDNLSQYYHIGENIRLYKRTWNDVITPKGIVVLVHGMAEHIDRYDEFAKTLNENRYIVYGYNQRGHKGSITTDDDYGFLHAKKGFDFLVTDLYHILQSVKEHNPTLPIYIFGHSMGSFVSQRFAQLYSNEFQGLILCGTGRKSNALLKIGNIVSKISILFYGKRHKSTFIDNLVFGKNNKKITPIRTKVDWLTQDEKEVDKYILDSYCGGKFSNAFYRDFFKMMLTINQKQKQISSNLPILMVSGNADPVGSCGKEVNVLFHTYQQIGITNVTCKLYSGRHEILNDFCKTAVTEDIITWLNRHTINSKIK